MRVRILVPMAGVMDGEHLSRFTPTLVYDVDPALGEQLIAMGTAVLDATATPALVLRSSGENEIEVTHVRGGVTVVPPPDKASDRSMRPSRRTQNPRQVT